MAGPDSVKRADKAPISTHPAFPAIVALWFAALLGLGCMVLPIALFEWLSTAFGLGAVVPGADPPLGFTARVAIALAAALAGAAAGLLLARQIVRSHAPQPRGLARVPAPECRPISAHDEFGEEGLGVPGLAPAERKRRLTAASERNFDGFPAGDDISAPADLPADGFGFAATDSPMQDQIMTEGQGFRPSAADRADEPDFAAADFVPPPQLSVVEPKRGDTAHSPQIDERPLEELGLVQLAGRLGAAIEKRRTLKAQRRASAPVVAPAPPAPAMPTDFEIAEAEDAARAIASFFGPSEAAAPPPPAPLRALQIDAEDDDDDEDAFESFSLPLRRHANGHGLSAAAAPGDDEGADEDETPEGEYSSLLAMKNPFSRHEEFVHGDEPELETGEFEPFDTFGAPPAGRADASVLPGGEHAAGASHWPNATAGNLTDSAAFAAPRGVRGGPADAERDLRAALATLQRMNGAA